MPDHKKKHKKAPYQNWLVPGVIGLVFLVVIGFIVKVVMTDVGPRKKEQISTVTLLKPPPEVKEKPPEPEVPKEVPKQEVIQDIPQQQDTPQNDQPRTIPRPATTWGWTPKGAPGATPSAWWERERGRAITLGGGGGGMNRLSLLAKYGWYTQKIQEEIKKQVKKKMDLDGGIPKGKFQTLVKIVLDTRGMIVKYPYCRRVRQQQDRRGAPGDPGGDKNQRAAAGGDACGDDAEDNLAGVGKTGPVTRAPLGADIGCVNRGT